MGKLTYKIDRIVSANNILHLGLKTGVELNIVNGNITTGETANNSTIFNKYLQSSTLIKYANTSSSTYGFGSTVNSQVLTTPLDISSSSPYADRNILATAGFVEHAVISREMSIYGWLDDHYLENDGRITITAATGDSATTPKKVIGLNPLYSSSSSFEQTTVGGNSTSTIYYDNTNSKVVAGELNSSGNALADSPSLFITGIEFDNYGAIKKVNVRQVSTADLNLSGELDNYVQWTLSDGTTTANITTSYDNTVANTNTNISKALTVTSGSSPIVASVASTNEGGAILTLGLDYVANGGLTVSSVNNAYKLDLSTVAGTSGENDALYKITVDTYGRVTNKTLLETIPTGMLPTLTHSASGIVEHIAQANTASTLTHTESSNGTGAVHFLIDNGTNIRWADVPFDGVYTDFSTLANKNYYLVGVDSSATTGLYTGHGKNDVYISGEDGYLHATFSGNGANLTALNATNITSGTLANARLDIETASTGLRAILGLSGITAASGNSIGANQVVLTDGSNGLKLVDTRIASAITISDQNNASVGIGVLSAQLDTNGVNTTTPNIGWRDIRTIVTNIVANEGGMRFMGVIGTNQQSEVTWTTVSGSFQKGDFYKIGDMTSFTPAEDWDLGGYKDELETGDTLVAVKDRDAAYATANANTKRTYWAPIQGNLKNAVTYNNANITNDALSYTVPVTSGTTTFLNGFAATGTIGENNAISWNITAKASSAAIADSLPSHTLWGQSFDGTGNVTGSLSEVGSITVANDNNTHNLGSTTKMFDNIYVEHIRGTGEGQNAIVPHLHGLADEASKVTNALTLKLSDDDANPVVYDGSAAQEFVFNVSTLNLFDTITADSNNSGQTGNVVTGVSLSRGGEGHETELVYTVTKDYVIDTISSDYFNIGGQNGTRTIGWYTGKSNNILRFYAPAAISGNLPSGTGNLCLDGKLTATNLDVVFSSEARHVAPMIKAGDGTGKDAKKEVNSNTSYLLVASDADTDGLSRFQESNAYVNSSSSGGSIQSGSMWDSVTGKVQIPTAVQVKALVDTIQTEIAAQEKVECARINFSLGTYNLTGSTAASHVIPTGAIIDHIDIYIDHEYSESATFSLSVNNQSGSVLIGTVSTANDMIDLTESDTTFSYKYSKPLVTNGTFTPVIVVSDSGASQANPNAGYGTCYIYYTKTPNGDGNTPSSVVQYAGA